MLHSCKEKGFRGPAVISKYALKILERYVKKNLGATAGDIKENVPEVAAVSLRHIRRLLVEKLRLRSRIAAHKPLLTRQIKAKRVAFAKKYRHWTEEDWSRVRDSDESTFRCLRATRSRIRRPAGSDRFNSCYTVKTVRHPASLMVWVSFTGACGCAGIFFLPPNVTMNGERYQKVLEDHLLPIMSIHWSMQLSSRRCPMPCLKKDKGILKDKPFKVIDSSGNSPDLNPIVNAWNFIKNKLSTKDISSIPKLKEAVLKMWTQDISTEYLSSLSNSIPKRIETVIKKITAT
jgi:hypothetical protein